MNANDKDMIIALRNRTTRLEHEGDCWSDEENEKLKRMFDEGMGITEIALILQRTEPAVMQQIEKLDLFQRKAYPKRRKYVKMYSSCPCEACTYDMDSCPHNGSCPKMEKEKEDVQ